MPKYEEEGEKYRPSILFTNSIDTVIKYLPSPQKIEIFHDENEHMFSSRVKALVPFCKMEWCIYIETAGDHVIYGIFRNIASIKDKALADIIFTNQALKDKADKTSAIMVYAENSWTVTMHSLRGNALNTNFALDIMGHNELDHEIAEFVDASFSRLKTTVKKLAEVKNMFRNIFKNVLRNVAGTMCVVVEHDYIRDEFFEDGIWLKEPISFSKLFLQTNSYSEQKLTAIAGLFTTMLDTDGLTIVDNTGRIMAFNVFVEANLRTAGNIIGGARKRAAYTIINSRRKGIVGIYFQSYDGEVFYAPAKK